MVQNSAARFVMKSSKRDCIQPTLRALHWLPIEYRVQYKILTIVHNCIYGHAPAYLKELITVYIPARQLRSINEKLLTVPSINMATLGGRAFSVAGPKAWNSLPNKLRNIKCLSSFKKQLKTHLFSIAF